MTIESTRTESPSIDTEISRVLWGVNAPGEVEIEVRGVGLGAAG
ncbi:hypothetical protein IMPR6_460021 [Imperialibacter sp. EC-SDR9]|nr:hypothetical protein IMPERIA89_640022 [Imperialibacter sp. 89]CAD5293842.1 hypothetical protein IMPERIA75_670022 [Imperialibacter sp. 75]VVT28654.1 hypothetical protein IMPR6_460021 [Imperialibacter sp. EC-SDR9]